MSMRLEFGNGKLIVAGGKKNGPNKVIVGLDGQTRRVGESMANDSDMHAVLEMTFPTQSQADFVAYALSGFVPVVTMVQP